MSTVFYAAGGLVAGGPGKIIFLTLSGPYLKLKRMNLSNLLSLSRIALMPFILLAMRHERDTALLFLMLLAAATDFLDGYLARRMGRVSDLGKILDPLADKICIVTMAVALSLWRGFPWWATAAIAGRDILILLGGLFLAKKTKKVPASNWAGKTAATFLAGALVLCAMRWQPWGYYLLIVSLVMAALSGALYLIEFIKKSKRA